MKNAKLILFTLTIFYSLITLLPVNAEAEAVKFFGNNSLTTNTGTTFLNSLNSETSRAKEPVSTTTLIKKHKDRSSLQSWFSYYFAPAQVAANAPIKLNGYRTVPFDGYLEGAARRGIAIDFGEYFLIETSTDLNISEADLMTNAVLTYNKTLKSRVAALKAASGCQCTDYAHELVPSLPYGLYTLQDKINTINHLFPQGNGGPMSSVAVHDVGTTAGHVSVVTGVGVRSIDGNLNVSITEKNLALDCRISTRTGTMEGLKIVGYFDPHYAVPSSFPNITGATNTTGNANVPFTVNLSGSSFDPSSMTAVILGGAYCTGFYSCQIPNAYLVNKTGSSVQVPLQLNSPGKYRLYIFNANQGKTSFGQAITVN
jgi:hypothetical protein